MSSQRSAADKQEQDSIYAAVDFDEYDEEDIYGSVVPSKQAVSDVSIAFSPLVQLSTFTFSIIHHIQPFPIDNTTTS